jgi:chaperonin GroES
MKIRPLHDVLVVEIEKRPEVTASGIIIPATAIERKCIGRVVAAGPGKWKWNSRTDEEWFQATEVQVGERVVFHRANLETQQGKQLCWTVGDDIGVIHETDVLLVIPEGDESRIEL